MGSWQTRYFDLKKYTLRDYLCWAPHRRREVRGERMNLCGDVRYSQRRDTTPRGRQTGLASHGLGSLTGGATSFDFQQYPAAQSLVRDVEAPRLIANVATGRGGGITGWYVRR